MKKKTLVILTMQNNTTIASKAHLVSKLFSKIVPNKKALELTNSSVFHRARDKLSY